MLIGAALLLAGCSKEAENEFQGWIEADLIFVSPDEQGRVETMMVREGDRVEKDTPLFTLDADLQRADLAVAEAAVDKHQAGFRARAAIAQVASGTQRDFDIAQAAYRQADAQLGAAQTRLDRRNSSSPVAGVIQQIYFRPGETVPASRPIMAVLPPGNIKVRFFIPERMLARIAIGDEVRVTCDGCANEYHGAGDLHLAQCRIHAAGHLQPRRTLQARLSRRGASCANRDAARRSAGQRGREMREAPK